MKWTIFFFRQQQPVALPTRKVNTKSAVMGSGACGPALRGCDDERTLVVILKNVAPSWSLELLFANKLLNTIASAVVKVMLKVELNIQGKKASAAECRTRLLYKNGILFLVEFFSILECFQTERQLSNARRANFQLRLMSAKRKHKWRTRVRESNNSDGRVRQNEATATPSLVRLKSEITDFALWPVNECSRILAILDFTSSRCRDYTRLYRSEKYEIAS